MGYGPSLQPFYITHSERQQQEIPRFIRLGNGKMKISLSNPEIFRAPNEYKETESMNQNHWAVVFLNSPPVLGSSAVDRRHPYGSISPMIG